MTTTLNPTPAIVPATREPLCACSPACRAHRPYDQHNCGACGTWAAPHSERDCPGYRSWLQTTWPRRGTQPSAPPTPTGARHVATRTGVIVIAAAALAALARAVLKAR